MHVVIANTVALNTGDAAIAVATKKIIEDHLPVDQPITLLDSQPEVSSRYYPQFAFKLTPFLPDRNLPKNRYLKRLTLITRQLAHRVPQSMWLHGPRQIASWWLDKETTEIINSIKAADVVLSCGGTYIIDPYMWEFKLWPLLVAKKMGKPVVMMTQSMGIFKSKRRRKLLAKVLPHFDLILVRDEKSASFLRDLEVPSSKVRMLYDTVFALADTSRFSKSDIPPKQPLSSVAFSLRYWPTFGTRTAADGMEKYMKSIAAAVTWLVRERNVQITFVSTCQGIPEYWTDDSKVAGEVLASLPDDVKRSCTLVSEYKGPTELIEYLGKFDLVVGTRMHACILALCGGTPVLPISYEFKTTELFRAFGLSERVQEMATIEPDSFVQLLSQYLDDLPKIRDHLKNQVAIAKESALTAGAHIRDVIQYGQLR